MKETIPISSLLAEASRSKCVVLTRRELRRVETSSDLRKVLLEVDCHQVECGGPESTEILGAGSGSSLGDAPAWVDAGALYEMLADHLATQGHTDFIFCLDPWAAQLLARGEEGAFAARWVFISDLEHRKTVAHPDYWNAMAVWLQGLPFHAIIPKEEWNLALVQEEMPVPKRTRSSIYLEKPGAWQWRSISRTLPKDGDLLFLVHYSNNLERIKVFLDSLARQDYPKACIKVAILVKEHSPELTRYLEWIALAHPAISLQAMDEGELPRALEKSGRALLILVRDSSILPEAFARAAHEAAHQMGGVGLSSVPLDLEATAHVITGNLDAVANYEKLLAAFGNGKSHERAAQLIPPESWMEGEGEAVSRILKLTQAEVPASGLALLQLARLP